MGTEFISQTGVGYSSIYQVNYLTPNNALHAMAIVTGTATYTVQYTMDDIFAEGFNPSTADWYTVAASTVNATISQMIVANTTHRGIRINVTSGTGTVTLKICAANIANKSSTDGGPLWA